MYIDEIAQTLREIAGGNLAFSLEQEYTGEFSKIKDSLDEISCQLNGVMGQLRAASRDVAADEVRMLTGKSSAAAKETNMLLGQTVDSMEAGARAAQDTSKSMLRKWANLSTGLRTTPSSSPPTHPASHKASIRLPRIDGQTKRK